MKQKTLVPSLTTSATYVALGAKRNDLTAELSRIEKEAAELQVQIGYIESVLKDVQAGKVDIIKDTRTRRTIERVERIIINSFSYARMKSHIRTEEVS